MTSHDCANGDHDSCFRAPDHPVVLALNLATCTCPCHLKRQPYDDSNDDSDKNPKAQNPQATDHDPASASAPAARLGGGQADQQ